jgi:hypothetical protein
MRHKPILHDPFHDNEPQISTVPNLDEPGDLPSIDSDESRAGKNPPPIKITDENHRSFFKHEKEHTKEYDFIKGKK